MSDIPEAFGVNESTWSTCGQISAVAFDAQGDGPIVDLVMVRANISASPHDPTCRITLLATSIGALALTVEQSAELRAMLERAEFKVRMALSKRIADLERLESAARAFVQAQSPLAGGDFAGDRFQDLEAALAGMQAP